MTDAVLSPEPAMRLAPVIPVLTIADVASAEPIARALVRGGLPALEVTLRTDAALDAIRAMATVPGAHVGAGTILNRDDALRARDAGARFLVSPGLSDGVVAGAREAGLPLLPGVATAGDLMRGLDHGLTHFKFFPAEANGGLSALAALAAPFGMARFCPTGGIDATRARAYLAHPSVLCVGGSWLVPPGLPDPAMIEVRAREAAALRP